MPANGSITFRTLNTSIRYGKQRFSAKGIEVIMKEKRLMPRVFRGEKNSCSGLHSKRNYRFQEKD